MTRQRSKVLVTRSHTWHAVRTVDSRPWRTRSRAPCTCRFPCEASHRPPCCVCRQSPPGSRERQLWLHQSVAGQWRRSVQVPRINQSINRSIDGDGLITTLRQTANTPRWLGSVTDTDCGPPSRGGCSCCDAGDAIGETLPPAVPLTIDVPVPDAHHPPTLSHR